MRRTYLSLCRGALVAALYVVLTLVSSVFGLSGTALVQLRISEALCVLPFFMPESVVGLTLGCLIANLATGALWQDIVFGTLATFLGAIGSLYLTKLPRWKVFWAVMPPIVSNTVIIPLVLKYAYHFQEGYRLLLGSLAMGEILSVAGLGIPLLLALKKRETYLFGREKRHGKT